MLPFIDLTDKTFGRLKVVSQGESMSGRARWNCVCECGGTALVIYSNLTRGNTKSCGCLQKERAVSANTKHGKAGTKTYKIWKGMNNRCSNVKDARYKDYGGRGIKVCDRWLSFEDFLADMGERPQGLTLEREKNDLGYSPDNCKWATVGEQGLNKRNNVRVEYNGRNLTYAEWARETGIPYQHIRSRIAVSGWSVEKALTTPVNKRM